MMIFISLVLAILGRRQDAEAEALDLAEQTAQDYSIIIEDPNPEILDPDVWKVSPCKACPDSDIFERYLLFLLTQNWFEELYGPNSVFMVTVCLNNGPLLQLFKLKRFLEHEMLLEAHDMEQYNTKKRSASTLDSGEPVRTKTLFKKTMEALGKPNFQTYLFPSFLSS
jgi:hypothetical protein